MSSQVRYISRKQRWQKKTKIFPSVQHRFWWLIHNCIAHPLLGFLPFSLAIVFHDWTAKHLNCYDKIRWSRYPILKDRYTKWFWHNLLGHFAIGLFPCKQTFEFHDRTSSEMKVYGWV